MWYTLYSVGDVDIDQEHANIDFMLSSLEPTDALFSSDMKRLLDALARHFVNEEHIADARGYHMSSEHREVHKKLTRQLEQIKRSIDDTTVDPTSITSALQDILRDHILEYDRYLLLPEEL